MSTKLEGPVVDAVANSNFKVLGEFPSLFLGESLEDNRIVGKQINENLVRGSARLNGALDSLFLRGAEDIVKPDMEEAQALVKLGTGVDPQSQSYLLAQTVTQLSASLASIEQFVKTAISTPPTTIPPAPAPAPAPK